MKGNRTANALAIALLTLVLMSTLLVVTTSGQVSGASTTMSIDQTGSTYVSPDPSSGAGPLPSAPQNLVVAGDAYFTGGE